MPAEPTAEELDERLDRLECEIARLQVDLDLCLDAVKALVQELGLRERFKRINEALDDRETETEPPTET